MKKRNGFVSNSSSSSFVISTKDYTKDKLREFLEALIEAERTIGNYVNDLDDILYFEEMTGKEFNKQLSESGYSDFYRGIDNSNEDFIIINSTRDNSIPWEIQDRLERIGMRYHWG